MPTTDELIDQAIAAMDSGQKALAQNLLGQVIRQDSHQVRAWLLMAEAQDDPERKRFCIQRALAIEPHNDMALRMLAEFSPPTATESDQMGRDFSTATPAPPQPEPPPAPSPEAAPASLAAKPSKTPGQIREDLEHAVTLIEKGQRDEGLSLLEEVVAADPRNEQAWLWMAVISGDPGLKRERLQKALDINPKSKMGRKLLAELDAAQMAQPTEVDHAYAHHYAGPGVWLSALTRPSPAAYEDFLRDPEASASRAFKWVAIAGAISYGLLAILLTLFASASLPPEALPPGTSFNPLVFLAIQLICGVPIVAAFACLGVALYAGIVHLTGSLVGGRGTFSDTLYAIAAYYAPMQIVGAVVGFIPFVNLCLGGLLGIYTVYLNVVAVKAAHRLDWGGAIIAGLMPILLGVVLGVCVAFFVVSTLSSSPELQDLFRQLATPQPGGP
jgi:hypothetical protein